MKIKRNLIICFGIALVLMTIGTASADTFTVNNSAGSLADFTSIQAAIDDVTTINGDTILVYPGSYNENVDVNKQLNIRSTGGSAATHVTSASSSDDVFEVTADGVTINGFHVSGTRSYNGINLNGIENCIVINNKVSDSLFALILAESSNNTLTNNTLSNNNHGIALIYSSNNNLTSNTVSDNTYNGISMFESSNNNTLTNNTVSNNRDGIDLLRCSNNTLASNTVSGNTHHGIYLFSSSNNLIYNNHFNNSQNTVFSRYYESNVWNTTKTAGTNIVGGPYLGGNYWAKPDGTGFSQINADTDLDGICDLPYNINVNNIDYLPLYLVTYNPYDENEDYVIDIGEVNAAIDDYRTQGPTSLADVNELIDLYRSGESYF